MIAYKSVITIVQKLITCRHLSVNNAKKFPTIYRALASIVHVWLPSKTQKFQVPNSFRKPRQKQSFPKNKRLARTIYGIYVATCVICHQHNVGQTVNNFSARWSINPYTWNKPHSRAVSLQIILSQHCTVFPRLQ